MLGVVELASFSPFSAVHVQFLEQLMEIIGVSLNAIIASSRTQELSWSRGDIELEQVRGAADPAGGAPADQQQARGRRPGCWPRRTAPSRSRPGDRGRAARTRGAGRAARALLPLQVGVPREHVARAADAAELPADPGQAAVGERRGEPQPAAGGVLADHPQRRHRPAPADQRHPRPVEVEVPEMDSTRWNGRLRDRGVRRGDLPAAHHREGPRFRRHGGSRRAPLAALRPAPAPAGAAQPLLVQPP